MLRYLVLVGFIVSVAARRATVRDLALEQNTDDLWLNANGETDVDCGTGPEFAKAKLLLTSSLWDDNEETMLRAFKDLSPPPGKALWIGDATAGSRPWHARFVYYFNTARQWMDKLEYSMERVMLHKGDQGAEAMEKLLQGVGLVYIEGGDHMFLMHAIRESGFGEALLPRFLDGSIVVVARSAGTIVSGLDVGFSLEKQSEGLLHGNFAGMGLAGKCSLRGHFQNAVWHNSTRPRGVSEVFVEEATAQFQRTNMTGLLVTLEDGQALLMKDGRTTIVQSGSPIVKDWDTAIKEDMPPDFVEWRESIFTEHADAFGQPADSSTWSTAISTSSSHANMKVILTSDLFSTGKTKPILKDVLSGMLGHRRGLKALWIHDARAGWGHLDMTQVWLMDTLQEVKEFNKCGIEASMGLWLDRWNDGGNLTLTENIKWALLPGQGYKPVSVMDVKARLDEASVLYVPGGNPFTFMKNIRSPMGREIWEHALARILSGDMVYIARSAGTILAGYRADLSADPRPSSWNSDADLAGLNLIPWKIAVRPHYHAFYIMTQTAHTPEWRAQHPCCSGWSQDDFLDSLAEKHPDVHGIRMGDGDFLTFYENRLSFMHGDSKVQDTVDDLSELFIRDDEHVADTELPDGHTYACCCGKTDDGTSVTCELKRTDNHWLFWSGARDCSDLAPTGYHPWHEVPEAWSDLEHAGSCAIPTSKIDHLILESDEA